MLFTLTNYNILSLLVSLMLVYLSFFMIYSAFTKYLISYDIFDQTDILFSNWISNVKQILSSNEKTFQSTNGRTL